MKMFLPARLSLIGLATCGVIVLGCGGRGEIGPGAQPDTNEGGKAPAGGSGGTAGSGGRRPTSGGAPAQGGTFSEGGRPVPSGGSPTGGWSSFGGWGAEGGFPSMGGAPSFGGALPGGAPNFGGVGGGPQTVCAPFLNTVCPEGTYCSYPVGACGEQKQLGVCLPQNCTSGVMQDPLCGCDGREYANPCEASRVGVSIRSLGPCTAKGCYLGDNYFPDGTSGIPAGDGCNSCSCRNGSLSCTLIGCLESSCIVNGTVYPTGTGAPDPASCNTCQCENGSFNGCTERFCPLGTPCQVGRAHYQNGRGYVTGDGSSVCICNEGTMTCEVIP